MIVTCPSCNAKYRVRDEAVPPGGAELECPECSAHFLAHPPSTDDLNRAIDKLTDAKEVLEAKVEELEEQRRKAFAEVDEARQELARLRTEGAQAINARDEEIARLNAEVDARTRELAQVQADRQRLLQTAEESSRLKQEINRAQQESAELRERMNAMGSLQAELDLARQRVQMLESQPSQHGPNVAALENEVKTLRDQLTRAMSAGGDANQAPLPAELSSMVAAMGPMLWGLEKAIEYLEPFAGNEPALAGHVRQLQLLAGMIKRLTAETGVSAG